MLLLPFLWLWAIQILGGPRQSPVGAAAGRDLLTLIFSDLKAAKIKRSQPAAAPTGAPQRRVRSPLTRGSSSRSLTALTFSIITTGQLSNPRQAPSIAPRIAAMVSVSPPRLAAMHRASKAFISPT